MPNSVEVVLKLTLFCRCLSVKKVFFSKRSRQVFENGYFWGAIDILKIHANLNGGSVDLADRIYMGRQNLSARFKN